MKDKEIKLEINGHEYTVVINEFSAYEAEVSVDGQKYKVGLKDLGAEQFTKIDVAVPTPRQVAVHKSKSHKADPSARMHRPKTLGDANAVVAPLPGQLLKLFVKEGDIIETGQKVCLIEAMKMENEVNSATGGMVVDIKYAEGDSVNQGDVLVLLKPVEN